MHYLVFPISTLLHPKMSIHLIKHEAHGPQFSPEKTSWKSINTYDYYNFDKEKKNSLFTLWELNGSLEQTWKPFTKGCTVLELVEIGPVVIEIFKFCQCIFVISLLSLPKDAMCQVWLKLAEWFWRRRFLKVWMNFC